MNQGAVTLYCPLRPGADWRALAALIRDSAAGSIPAHLQAALAAQVPTLHFLSLFVIEPRDGNPATLCLEASFDGVHRYFLDALVAAAHPLLDRLCQDCVGYQGGSPADLRSFLQSRNIRNQLFYVGCPGRTTGQIEEERGLAERVEARARTLARRTRRRRGLVREIWQALDPADRQTVLSVPERPFWVQAALAERPLAALYRLLQWAFFSIGIAVFLLVAAQAAGYPLWPAIAPPSWVATATGYWARFLLCIAGWITLVWALALAFEFPAALTPRTTFYVIGVKLGEYLVAALSAIPAFLAILGLIALVHWHEARLLAVAKFVLCALLLLGIVLVLVWLWQLARIARRELDDRVDEMRWNAAHLATVCEREDDLLQNHFVSVTQIRPGRLRIAVLHVVLFSIHWLARILHNPRGLFNTQSIHFARWVVLPGRRLMFISNYDGSFGGYLGIFATLGAAGVSAIWGNTEGFPRTFLLFGDGARDEQRFKARARASQVETLFWYRRYRDLTVAAIERNAAIREALARFSASGGTLPETELDALLQRFSTPTP